MILKISCPSCHKGYRLSPPYPPPGKRYRCTCETIITLTYPPEIIAMMKSGGFEGMEFDLSSDAAPQERSSEKTADRTQESTRSDVHISTTPSSSSPSTQPPKSPPVDAPGAPNAARTASDTALKSPDTSNTTAPKKFTSDLAIHLSQTVQAQLEAERAAAEKAAAEKAAAEKAAAEKAAAEKAAAEKAAAEKAAAEKAAAEKAAAERAAAEKAAAEKAAAEKAAAAERAAAEKAAAERAAAEKAAAEKAAAERAAAEKAAAERAAAEKAAAEKAAAEKAAAEKAAAEKAAAEKAAAEKAAAEKAAAEKAAAEKAAAEKAAAEKAAAEKAADERAAAEKAADERAAADNADADKAAEQPESPSESSPGDVEPAVEPPVQVSSERVGPSSQEGPRIPQKRPPRKPFRLRWVHVLAAFTLMLVSSVAAVAGVLWSYNEQLPPLTALNNYRPPIGSMVYARDGRLIGEYYGEERRYVVPYEAIPRRVIEAFVAAEDAAFFEHKGIDLRSILRAFIANVREKRLAQGGSTITQQVARSFLLTREKKLERKIIEALLAYRIESTFTKEQILHLYLNQIYLGEGAYGVQAASRVYFDKDMDKLTLGEVSLLAGLPPAPSRYSPLDHFQEAKERQRYVLRNMQVQKFISSDEAQAAESENLNLQPRRSLNTEIAPYVTEHVRRLLVDRYGDDTVFKGGLQIYTTIDYDLQQQAQKAVRAGVERVDHRMGWMGPKKHIAAAQVNAFALEYESEFHAQQQLEKAGGVERFGAPATGPMALEVGKIYQGVAASVKDTYALVRVGSHEAILPLDNMEWAYPIDPARSWKGRQLDRISRVMKVGDVFPVQVINSRYEGKRGPNDKGARIELALHQEPKLEGALLAYQLADGAVVAMVGGYDYNRSRFIRPIQAHRQMGSAFKPLIYSAALDHPMRNYSPSSILIDAPIAIDSGARDLWRPTNYDGSYMGAMSLRKALYLSRNTPAVRVMQDIGPKYASTYVKKLGFKSQINRDYSMVLGTPSVTLLEMCRAFSAFADRGRLVEPEFLDRVLDRDGKVLFQRPEQPLKTQVIPASTAFLMTSILQDVVRHGTATKALSLGKITAGKTGTTNEWVDASYIGFTPALVTGVWVGFDQPQTLGYGQTGGDAALPLWIDFMEEALKKYPEEEFETPEDITFAEVDPSTGYLASEESPSRVRLPFKKGRTPGPPPPPEPVETGDFLSSDTGL